MHLDVRPLQILGATPGGYRRVGVFETAAIRYAWLNNVVAVGIGYRRADGAVYSIFEVL